MTGIVHKAVKVSGEKGLATEWNDDHEITGNIDVDQNQFLNNVIENRTDFPAGPVEGQIVYRTDLKNFYVYDGTNWGEVHYWTCAGCNFVAQLPDSDDVVITGYTIGASANNITFYAPVFLPHGATVTAVKVYADISDETWTLRRCPLVNTSHSEMAGANMNTEDTIITNPIIDNINYKYYIATSSLDIGDAIYGVRITYTL